MGCWSRRIRRIVSIVSNLLGRIRSGVGNLFSNPNNVSVSDVLSSPLFSAGMGLLQAGQDSRINPIAAVQQGLLNSEKMRLARGEEERRRRLREAYPAALDAFFPGRVVGGMEMNPQPVPRTPGTEIVDMGPPTPPVIQQDPRRAIFEAAGPERGMESLLGVIAPTSGDPSTVREWKFFSGLSPDEQEAYLGMKRNPWMSYGDTFISDPRASGNASILKVDDPDFMASQRQLGEGKAVQAEITDTAKAEVELSFAGALAAAKASGLEWGKSKAQAQISLPGARIAAQQFNDQIDIVLKHPGFSMAVGASSYVPQLRGSDANNFNAELKKLGGKIFGQAYQSLKGGGQITEIEAEKAEQAYANLDVGMSEEAFRNQLLELKKIISDGLMKLEAEAGRKSELDELEKEFG